MMVNVQLFKKVLVASVLRNVRVIRTVIVMINVALTDVDIHANVQKEEVVKEYIYISKCV